MNVATAFAMVLCAVLAFGQNTGLSNGDREAVEALLDDYNQAFIKKNYASMRNHVRAPFVVIVSNEPQLLTSIDDIIAFYRTRREPLDQRGYATSKLIGAPGLTMLAPDRLLWQRTFHRFKTDGSLLEEGTAFYLVTKAQETWKISGLIRQDTAYVNKK